MIGPSQGRFDLWRRSTTPVRSRFAPSLLYFCADSRTRSGPDLRSTRRPFSPDLLTDKNIGNEQTASEKFKQINEAYQRLTAEPEDVLHLEHDGDEFDELGPGFFFRFEIQAGVAEDFFRRFWDDLGSYSDDEFERTYHDYTHRNKQTRFREKVRKRREGKPDADSAVPRKRSASNDAAAAVNADADADEEPNATCQRPPTGTADDGWETVSAPSRSSERTNARFLSEDHASPPRASISNSTVSAIAKKKNAAPLSSRETALAAVAAAEAAERAAEAAEAEKKRADRLAAMTSGERAAESMREEMEAAAAAAKEDARAAAALEAAESADSASEKAAPEEESRGAAERISAALAAADEAARESRFAKWDALWDASPRNPPSNSAGKPGQPSGTGRAPIETFETSASAPEVSAPPRATPPEAVLQALREIPCRYFSRENACRFGDACRFAHDRAAALEAEASVSAADHSAAAPRGSKVAAYEAASHAQRRAKAYKTKPCRYWSQKGTCARGDACGFIHGDAPEHLKGVDPAMQTERFASRSKTYKTKPCRYWSQKGTCARGDACGFIHGDAPEHLKGVDPAMQTERFASHSATYCSVCRLSFHTEHELVEHLWSDKHRDRINDAFEAREDA